MADSDLRLRFCPSPTGTPHVGMIRTALFNWAYARHMGGKLIFRIEDTDAERDSEESYQQILDSLQWLGIDWDEGMEIGGPHGPYRQSERMDIYRDAAKKLLEGGFAYESYSLPEEIAARNKANGKSEQLGYDGYDRELSDAQIAKFKDEGRPAVIRVRMPDEDISFDDAVRGEITFKQEHVPDFVIVRGNGEPLYTLTNPVDDALMDVNLVMRGEDLLSSTPRQIALYDSLKKIGVAKQTPRFAHLPYVMGEGNKKLSKRDPESNLLLHRENGMIPEGLLNYLALLGWSIAPDRDVFSMKELVEAFDVKDVNPNPARFDQKKCLAINSEHIRLLSIEDLAGRVSPYLENAGLKPDQDVLLRATALIQERIQVLSESVNMLAFFFTDDIQYEPDALAELKDGYQDILAEGVKLLEAQSDFSAGELHDLFYEKFVEELGLKPRLAFTPFRVAITGRRVSPPLFESIEILGKDRVINRLENFPNYGTSPAAD